MKLEIFLIHFNLEKVLLEEYETWQSTISFYNNKHYPVRRDSDLGVIYKSSYNFCPFCSILKSVSQKVQYKQLVILRFHFRYANHLKFKFVTVLTVFQTGPLITKICLRETISIFCPNSDKKIEDREESNPFSILIFLKLMTQLWLSKSMTISRAPPYGTSWRRRQSHRN